MVKYLSFDGVDDRLTINGSIGALTEFVITIKPRPQAWEQYINFGGKQVNATGSNTDAFHADYQSVYVDGVLVTTNTRFIKLDTKQVLRGVLKSGITTGTNGSHIFFNGGSAFMEGEIYDVKLYNGTTLKAHYDMSTGTVQDQSGNGNHATLTGGTWMDDGTGGGTTPTVHEGENILSSASNLTAESNLIYNGESTLSAVSDLIAEASVIQSAEVILSAVSNLSAIGSVVVNGETILSANSDLSALGEIISLDISVDLSASAYLTVEGSVIQSGEASFSAVSQLEALASLIVSGEVELSATSQLTVLPEKDLVGVIRLKGKRELFIYLKGNRELEVHLKGGLNVTEYNQNFTMESGDSKILSYAIDDDLNGATLTWEMYQRGQTTPSISKVGTFMNGSVQVELLPSDTQAINGTYKYELQCVDVLSKKSTLAKGVITLE